MLKIDIEKNITIFFLKCQVFFVYWGKKIDILTSKWDSNFNVLIMSLFLLFIEQIGMIVTFNTGSQGELTAGKCQILVLNRYFSITIFWV